MKLPQYVSRTIPLQDMISDDIDLDYILLSVLEYLVDPDHILLSASLSASASLNFADKAAMSVLECLLAGIAQYAMDITSPDVA